jgi:hypothetical protein
VAGFFQFPARASGGLYRASPEHVPGSPGWLAEEPGQGPAPMALVLIVKYSRAYSADVTLIFFG